MQGAKYSMIMDSCINDFVSGEIEHAVHEAWKNESPDLIVIEGQGSLMNPAYPGGFEILAAGRPDYEKERRWCNPEHGINWWCESASKPHLVQRVERVGDHCNALHGD